MFTVTFSTTPQQFLHSLHLAETGNPDMLVRVETSPCVAPRNFATEPHLVWNSDDGYTIELSRPTQANHVRLVFRDAVDLGSITARYQQRLPNEAILKKVASQRLIFVGCARNCAEKLVATINVLKQIGTLFSDYRIVVFENDSTDQTLNILNEAAGRDLRLMVLTDKNVDAKLPERTERLAHARNTLTRFVLDHYGNFDYLSWADMDGIVDNTFSIEGFLTNFGITEVWDAVFPVTNSFYYDIWALRHKTLCADDYHEAIKNCDASLGNELIVTYHAFLRQTRLQNLPNWLRVDSAFGGMAIYKMETVGQASYLGFEHGNPICEHVPFNLKLTNLGKRLYINPEFVVSYPEHKARDSAINNMFFDQDPK